MTEIRWNRSPKTPYLQYFIGLPAFQEEASFDPSLMTHFRKRLGTDAVNKVNEWIVMEGAKADSQDTDDPGDGNTSIDSSHSSDEAKNTPQKPTSNQEKLLLDATCAPADIAYPTDLSLLIEAQRKVEQMIDAVHAPPPGSLPKSGT